MTRQERCDQLHRRAKKLQDGYRTSESENLALKIQKMQLEAYGANKVLPAQRDVLLKNLVQACRQRNEAREALRGLITLVELDKEVDDVGSDLWAAIYRGREVLSDPITLVKMEIK
jgi:hypothetical protein